jgi:hypothetical protein
VEKHRAEQFAEAWIAAWNSHDLRRILSHYEDDFEMSSPAIIKITGEGSGTLKGKSAVSAYWSTALEKYPELNFKLLHVLRGANSLTLIYEGVLGLSAEVFHFGVDGLVNKAFAHYDL